MNVASMSVGFVDLPKKITLNIFAQGCRHKCDNCSNPQLWPMNSDFSVYLSNAQFIDELSRVKPIVKWICWLGGDATYQPQRLIELSKLAKENGFNNCLYTGFDFASKNIQSVIEYIDIVIDGKWQGIPITEEHTNQQIFVKQNDKTFKKVKWYNGELYEAIR